MIFLKSDMLLKEAYGEFIKAKQSNDIADWYRVDRLTRDIITATGLFTDANTTAFGIYPPWNHDPFHSASEDYAMAFVIRTMFELYYNQEIHMMPFTSDILWFLYKLSHEDTTLLTDDKRLNDLIAKHLQCDCREGNKLEIFTQAIQLIIENMPHQYNLEYIKLNSLGVYFATIEHSHIIPQQMPTKFAVDAVFDNITSKAVDILKNQKGSE